MISLILEEEDFNSINTRKLFEIFEVNKNKYNWLISDIESYDEKLNNSQKQSIFFSSGELKSEILDKDIGFIWAVFSAIPKNISRDDIEKYIPIADGNREIWSQPSPLHPLADSEIIFFDSTFLVIKSKDDLLYDKLKEYFPSIVTMLDYLKQKQRY